MDVYDYETLKEVESGLRQQCSLHYIKYLLSFTFHKTPTSSLSPYLSLSFFFKHTQNTNRATTMHHQHQLIYIPNICLRRGRAQKPNLLACLLISFQFLLFQKMERKGAVRSNEKIKIRLPPGFRFDPTDQELVLYYLKPKVFSLPLPASVIPEISLKKYDPWDLPGNMFLFLFKIIFLLLDTIFFLTFS